MSYIIAVRNPVTKEIKIISDYDQNGFPVIREYVRRDIAEEEALNIKMCNAWGYQLLEVKGHELD